MGQAKVIAGCGPLKTGFLERAVPLTAPIGRNLKFSFHCHKKLCISLTLSIPDCRVEGPDDSRLRVILVRESYL